MLTVAIVGKPNVGKSTLFNRIISERKSIVLDEPGVTRDRIYGIGEWLNKKFSIIDTGGLTNEELPFAENIKIQVGYALDEADVILFVVSAKDGINENDLYVAKLLRKFKHKKIILVGNKSESDKNQNVDFYQLGFGKIFYISAEHGIGVGDLLDEIVKLDDSKPTDEVEEQQDKTSFCIIGRTNVGKSTLMNAILNKERSLVSEQEHSTHDAIDEDFEYEGKQYTIIDTAGIRRKGKIVQLVERFSVMRTEKAISRSKVVILLLDGSNDFNEQDEIIGGLAFKANIPTIICVNKWDLARKNKISVEQTTTTIRQKFKFLSWAPIIYVSAKNQYNIPLIFDTINAIQREQTIKVNTSMLNNILAKAQITNPPPLYHGGRIAISYATQVNSQIPTFVLFVNKPEFLHFTYGRYIENKIRESFGIKYTPITVYYKSKDARIRKE